MLVLPIFCVLNSIFALYFFSEYLHFPATQLSTIFYRAPPLFTIRPSAPPLYPLPAIDLHYLDYLRISDSHREVCSTPERLLDRVEKHRQLRTVQGTPFSEVVHFNGFIRADEESSKLFSIPLNSSVLSPVAVCLVIAFALTASIIACLFTRQSRQYAVSETWELPTIAHSRRLTSVIIEDKNYETRCPIHSHTFGVPLQVPAVNLPEFSTSTDQMPRPENATSESLDGIDLKFDCELESNQVDGPECELEQVSTTDAKPSKDNNISGEKTRAVSRETLERCSSLVEDSQGSTHTYLQQVETEVITSDREETERTATWVFRLDTEMESVNEEEIIEEQSLIEDFDILPETVTQVEPGDSKSFQDDSLPSLSLELHNTGLEQVTASQAEICEPREMETTPSLHATSPDGTSAGREHLDKASDVSIGSGATEERGRTTRRDHRHSRGRSLPSTFSKPRSRSVPGSEPAVSRPTDNSTLFGGEHYKPAPGPVASSQEASQTVVMQRNRSISPPRPLLDRREATPGPSQLKSSHACEGVAFRGYVPPQPATVDRSSDGRRASGYDCDPLRKFSIFVGGLHQDTSDLDLYDLFKRTPPNGYKNGVQMPISIFCSCSVARVVRDPHTKLSRLFGFVKFADRRDYERALLEMDGVWYRGKQLQVFPDRSRPDARSPPLTRSPSTMQTTGIAPYSGGVMLGRLPHQTRGGWGGMR